MRPFEIILTLSLLIAIIGRYLPSLFKTNPLIYRIFAVAVVIIAILHFVFEGNRWQMLPVLILLGILLVEIGLFVEFDRSILPNRGWGGVGIGFLIILFLIPGITLPLLFPVLTLPKPTGSYAIGTTAFGHVDPSRQEIFGPTPGSSREFVTQIWYPAKPDPDNQLVSYLPKAEITTRTLAERLGLPFFILDHLKLLRTYSFEDAPPANDGPYPVLIFSHGYNSNRFQSTTLMEDLASHGYIVVALTHTYGSAITIFPDERIIFHDPDTLIGEGDVLRASGLKLGEQWLGDIEFVLNDLESDAHPLRDQLDMESVGIFGHSTGGGVTFHACYVDERCQAALGLDAWFGPVPEEVIRNGIEKPAYFLMSESWPKPENIARIEEFIQASDNAEWATVLQTGHYDFSDIPFLSPLTHRLGLSGQIDAYRGQEVNRAYVRAFFDQHLKGVASDFLYTPSANFSEVVLKE